VLLRDPKLPSCQQLHFLQMACEKLSKAYLCWRGADPNTLQGSHAYISTTIPQIVIQQLSRQSPKAQQSGGSVMRGIRTLARQIELLAPAVDAAGRAPANCEYPWEDSTGTVRVPAEHKFALDLLYAPAGRHLLKAITVGAEELTK
jgi:hypothetical protein